MVNIKVLGTGCANCQRLEASMHRGCDGCGVCVTECCGNAIEMSAS